MSAETPRICLCPCGRDLDRDFDPPMNKGAVVGRDSKCRNWYRNKKKTDCERYDPKTGRIRGHSKEVGICERCGMDVLRPRMPSTTRKLRSGPDKDGNLDLSGPKVTTLRFRDENDPPPKYAPKAEEFIKPDGTLLYEGRSLSQVEPLSGVELAKQRRSREDKDPAKWLNRVAPDPAYLNPPDFERTSKHYPPACRSGGENAYTKTWDAPGASDRDIFRWRDLRDRGIKVEGLPAWREWSEWEAGVPQSGVLPPSPAAADDDGSTLGSPLPKLHGGKDCTGCGVTYTAAREGDVCLRCAEAGREKVKHSPTPLYVAIRKRQIARLQKHVAEATAEARAVAAEKSGNRQAA